ncbi:MAG: cbb3-type cytochrome oxidase assembly protein CcoS [Chitinophagaceae bacterium]
MSVLIILIIVSILVAGGFLAAFLWSVKSGQYDDDYTPSVRMLFDDKPTSDKNSSITQNSQDASREISL